MTAGKDTRPHPLARLFYENRHLLILVMVVIAVGGITALRTMPRLEDPVIVNRNPQILTLFPGASADRVEALISEPIEQALQEVPEIKFVKSTSSNDISVVVIELKDDIGTPQNKRIFSEIRDKLNDAAANFPPGAEPPFFDDKRNAVGFTLIVSLGWEEGEPNMRILKRLSQDLADRLRSVPGTEVVRLFGDPNEEIAVTIDPAHLANLGLQPSDVTRALQQADSKTPAGTLFGSEVDLPIEVVGELDTVQRITSVPVAQDSLGRTVRVGDVAEVRRDIQTPASAISMVDGERTVLVAARVVSDNLVDVWTERAQAEVDAFKAEVGGGINVEVIFEQDRYIVERLRSLGENLLLGACVVLIVILLSMGLRSSIIVGAALPLTAAMTLFIINITGGKLHQMSIFGMIIALGLLIDNAIVVTDEVRKHRRNGLSPLNAASAAIRHLFFPLLSSTLTTVLSFMPIALLTGGAGDFVGSIAISVIIAVISSFFISMTIIASLAAMSKVPSESERGRFAWIRSGLSGKHLAQYFGSLLGFFLKHPVIAILFNLALPLLGVMLAGTLGSQFFPRTDRDMFEIDVWLPPETSIDKTSQVVAFLEDHLEQDEEVRRVSWLIGGSYPTVYYNLIVNSDESPFYAHGIITTTDADNTDRIVKEFQDWADENVPQAQIVARKFAQGPPADADVELRLYGPSIPRLQELGEQVRLVLAEQPGILHTRMTIPRGQPKLWLDVSEEDLSLAGLSLTESAAQLQSQLSGDVAGIVIEGIEDLPIRVRRPDEQRASLADVESITLSDSSLAGGWLPVSAIGELELRPSESSIDRRKNERLNSVLGFARTGTLPIDITNNVIAELEEKGFELPAGYRLELGGESENQGNAVGNLKTFLPVLVVTMVAVLILSFRNLRLALILLVAAPLSVGYGLLATWAMGFPLSFNTIIGSMGLMGLAFNDNIVVLAALHARRKECAADNQVIIHEVLDCGRHLISTTLTTIGSFLPLLLIIGGEFWPPLAIVLAGGVGGATLIAFTLTPVLYRITVAKFEKI
ncbi:efflux RND transporter permease subunit [Rubellicoccus peritrichatus]|uniref:Efflux RND transporter permease subunit n=1 Tax=Rubellicoccus peritrichatus TaxID=3080537 RepID=A0AAQ3LBS7_9BACT|nr:efflux RND transporter permease subunit [Puniceicoccus sp. CR14]WOO42491.1 efflux RND transporter permease subunit [Puniceicoccus sp. CR14]